VFVKSKDEGLVVAGVAYTQNIKKAVFSIKISVVIDSQPLTESCVDVHKGTTNTKKRSLIPSPAMAEGGCTDIGGAA